MTAPDTQTLYSNAWLKFVCFEGTGLYLGDRSLFKNKNCEHAKMPTQYGVVRFDIDDPRCQIQSCNNCGEANVAFAAKGGLDIIHCGDSLADAEAAFEAAEAELRAVAHG